MCLAKNGINMKPCVHKQKNPRTFIPLFYRLPLTLYLPHIKDQRAVFKAASAPPYYFTSSSVALPLSLKGGLT